ncbi:hypothetical protein LTS15_004874 [Exophiala xenobiotica]|nr:hypothetical protein LTS15_004874 [Exophiala xenobiotica]
MLALKSMRVSSLATEHARSFQDLPPEILGLIADQLYDAGFGLADGLPAFSLVSRQCRLAALPFMFGNISHVVRDNLDQQEHGTLGLFLNYPHLLRHAKELHVVRPAVIRGFVPSLDHASTRRLIQEHMSADLQVIMDGLTLMPRLHRIRLDCSAAAALEILMLLPADAIYEIVLDEIYSPYWPLIEATTELATVGSRHRFALGAFGLEPSQHDLNDQATYDAIAKAAAVVLHMAWLLKDNRVHQGSSIARGPYIAETPSWTELWLLIRRACGTTTFSIRDLDLEIVPWANLRRLSISWEYAMPMNQFIFDVAPKLNSLEALRLRAAHQRLYHPACKYDVPTTGLFADTPIVPAFEIDYAQMRELRELEIDGICNHIPIEALLGPKLRSLRLHREDTLWSVYSPESQRTPGDILSATKICPNLERLELDIGYIENLWHPTAIPGVDVDMEQYSFLNAISKFRRLRHLRLFPPFVPKDSPRFSRSVPHCVPVSDDQAIRLFEHLRKECPSLQVLSIAAIPSFVMIDTMCWVVKRRGEKTILTTKHQKRNYQHRQIWVGQRRITSEIQRFSAPPRYLPDLDGWMLSRHDIYGFR